MQKYAGGRKYEALCLKERCKEHGMMMLGERDWSGNGNLDVTGLRDDERHNDRLYSPHEKLRALRKFKRAS